MKMKYIPGDFFQVANASKLEGIDSLAQIIYMWMCRMAYGENKTFPSISKLSKCSGIKSRDTIIKKIKILEDLGFIIKTKSKTEGGAHNHNNYELLLIPSSLNGHLELEETLECPSVSVECPSSEPALVRQVDTNNSSINNNIILRSPLSQNSSDEELLTSENSNSLNLPLTNGGESSKETGGRLELDEKQIKENKKKEMDKNIASLIKVFNDVNKACGYAHKGHRMNAELLLEQYGIDIVLDMAKTAIASNRLEYAPIILTPSDLFYKLAKLKLFIDKQKG